MPARSDAITASKEPPVAGGSEPSKFDVDSRVPVGAKHRWRPDTPGQETLHIRLARAVHGRLDIPGPAGRVDLEVERTYAPRAPIGYRQLRLTVRRVAHPELNGIRGLVRKSRYSQWARSGHRLRGLLNAGIDGDPAIPSARITSQHFGPAGKPMNPDRLPVAVARVGVLIATREARNDEEKGRRPTHRGECTPFAPLATGARRRRS